MNQDWHFTAGDCTCSLRAAGVILKDNRILLQREKDGNEYALPGGTVKTGETTSAALIREFKEEAGAAVKIDRFLWTEEVFWEYNGKKQHSIAFYYLAELMENCYIPDTGEFVPHKDNEGVLLGWVPIGELQKLTVYPEFLKTEIHRLTASTPQHFVTFSSEQEKANK